MNLGNELKPTQLIEKPTVQWQAERGAYYTPVMFDPDENRAYNEVRHWLVMNILESSVEKGNEVIAYMGSETPKGVGLLRYITLLYKQPTGKITMVQYIAP